MKTALHEAAHAVVATLVGIPVRRVAIFDGGDGICELEPASPRRALLVVVAGAAASRLHDGTAEDWWKL